MYVYILTFFNLLSSIRNYGFRDKIMSVFAQILLRYVRFKRLLRSVPEMVGINTMGLYRVDVLRGDDGCKKVKNVTLIYMLWYIYHIFSKTLGIFRAHEYQFSVDDSKIFLVKYRFKGDIRLSMFHSSSYFYFNNDFDEFIKKCYSSPKTGMQRWPIRIKEMKFIEEGKERDVKSELFQCLFVPSPDAALSNFCQHIDCWAVNEPPQLVVVEKNANGENYEEHEWRHVRMLTLPEVLSIVTI